MGLMILATGLYINACAKGEHMIPQTVRPLRWFIMIYTDTSQQWDMFHEKFGFMLIFWNMAGMSIFLSSRFEYSCDFIFQVFPLLTATP